MVQKETEVQKAIVQLELGIWTSAQGQPATCAILSPILIDLYKCRSIQVGPFIPKEYKPTCSAHCPPNFF